jgi:outer membrane protein assembly factor BamA
MTYPPNPLGTWESISATGSSSSRRLLLAFFRGILAIALVLVASFAVAQNQPGQGSTPDLPQLPDKLPDASAFEGKPVSSVRAKVDGAIWTKPPAITRPQVGGTFSLAEARAELARLLASGGFAQGSLEVSAGVEVVYRLVPSRLVRSVTFKGNPLTDDEVRRAVALSDMRDVTEKSMDAIADKVRSLLVVRGWPKPVVEVSTIETDQPLTVIVQVAIEAGPANIIDNRVFAGLPTWDPAAAAAANKYDVKPGERADEERLEAADRALANTLRGAGFPNAAVTHSTAPATISSHVVLTVAVAAGAKVIPSFEGNIVYDNDQLLEILSLKDEADRSPQRLAAKIEAAYRRRGLFDAQVETELLGKPGDAKRTLRFKIREGDAVRVTKRIFPCLEGALTAKRLDEEIDSFLEEDFGHEGFGDANEKVADEQIGGGTGTRPKPDLPPTHEIFVAETYDRATEHLRELFKSEGYMFAEIGDPGILRGSCAKKSMPGAKGCNALPAPPFDQSKMCSFDPNRLPLPPPAVEKKAACIVDHARGIECAPTMTVVIAVNPGPRSYLWDIQFDGVKSIAPKTLMAKAAGPQLRMGEPLSLRDAESARRAILDYYKDEGYAYASVRATFEYSADKSRARIRFLVAEGEQVVIDKIYVEGNKRTLESLVLKRLLIGEGGIYRARLVRESYDRLAQLGVFQSINIALVNPTIPAKHKSVIVTVVERPLQHFDYGIGYATGEGFRFSGEYGYRNFFGYAVSMDLRVRFSWQPFIGCANEIENCNSSLYDPVVVRRWTQQTVGLERYPRRLAMAWTFPQTPFGSAARATLELVNILDLRRDFVLNKYSPILSLVYQPWRPFTLTVSTDVELNNFKTFDSQEINQLIAASPALASQLRVPEGSTGVTSLAGNVVFDFRDNRLGATKGWYAQLLTEYVRGIVQPEGQPKQDFLHLDSGAAVYKKLDFLPKQPVIAFALRGGVNFNVLSCSGVGDTSLCDTYPDRLFYLGGIETNRGFFAGQMLPQDSIDKLAVDPNAILNAAPCNSLPVDPLNAANPANVAVGGIANRPSGGCLNNLGDIAPRGGNVYINPRIELRVPAFKWGGLVFFVDASNTWRDKSQFQPWRLRYSIGPGLSIDTPVGPVALDFGFNLSRYAQFGEPLMVFNFSIGRF